MNVDLVFRATATEWDRLLGAEDACNLEARFEELVRRQSSFVFRVAYAVLRNADDAEDVVQETFLKLFRNRSWLNMKDERAFLARTVWRVAIGRKPSARPPISGADVVEASPESAVIEGQRTRQVHALIDSLPERLRRPLALSALQELTVAEIAVIMNEPEGTVRRRIVEARALLKQKLERINHHAR